MVQQTKPESAENPADRPAPAPSADGAGEVPEQPALAPNVQLSGAMQQSGFADQQWLVERDGRFVQLTELLYRIAEQANGQRRLDQIAAAVSQAINRKVSAANVRQLIAAKLIPLGLIVKADGSVAGPEGGAARSPLAVNLRMKMVDPRLVDTVARTLQFFHWPPIVVGFLLVTALAQGWLFFVHGLSGGVHDALYTPGLMPILLLIIIVSAAFHEFGHASGLRYGGGRVRGMGVGLYLVYPAFYTDVTDNYRLGRWGRVRTDLGGFYFNLIFALAVMGLYLLTGHEFLLLVVLLIDLEIIHQLLPFVRLDGYWALADLTGIPDFFSQIGPFLRTVLPLPWWQGRKLPDLKGWVKLVFALYILITIPLLVFLLFAMVKSVPRILATAGDSLLKQFGAANGALNSGDWLGLLGAAGQIVLLALPTLGLLYVLYILGKKVGVALWNWSKPSTGRRVAASAGMLGLTGLIACLWLPQLPFGWARPAALQASYTPIQREERGTVFDTVSLPNMVQTPLEDRRGPSRAPARTPAARPSAGPSGAPTMNPATSPTAGPAGAPTNAPGTSPTAGAASSPTAGATTSPTTAPTVASGSVTPAPGGAPGALPTPAPAGAPTRAPTPAPTVVGPATAPGTTPTQPPATAPGTAPTPQPASSPAIAPTPAR